MTHPPLILASASPRRLELLHSLGLTHIQVISSNIDETPREKELPSRYVMRMAQEKAEAVQATHHSQAFILSADTIVAMGRRIFQKAETEEEARQQIILFSGRRHRVYTGIHLVTPEGKRVSRLACTRVAFKHLSDLEIKNFLESREWEGVCGYRLQGRAGAFISWINGSPSTILGLPVYDTAQLLHGNGYPLWNSSF